MTPPIKKLRFSRALLWLLYPLVYLVCSLLRGAYDGFYPYPFINPNANGVTPVIVTSAIITGACIIATWLITLRHKKSKTPEKRVKAKR
ncbi:MAG: Pr6Pr family membrane protein [Candidatus Saccharimonadales bacterium]